MLASITNNNNFFQHIIHLIPKDLYKSQPDSGDTDEDEEDLIENQNKVSLDGKSSKYFKHRKLPLSVDDRKLMSKQAKKEKYKNLDVNFNDIKSLPTNEYTIDSNDKIEEEYTTSDAMESLRKRLQVFFYNQFEIFLTT